MPMRSAHTQWHAVMQILSSDWSAYTNAFSIYLVLTYSMQGRATKGASLRYAPRASGADNSSVGPWRRAVPCAHSRSRVTCTLACTIGCDDLLEGLMVHLAQQRWSLGSMAMVTRLNGYLGHLETAWKTMRWSGADGSRAPPPAVADGARV
jgi:hypothetical protein